MTESSAPLARDPRLDGLRGIAVLLVVLFHASVGSGGFVTSNALLGDAGGTDVVTRGLLQATLLGWSGVDLFFVLSGYLITGILLRTRDAERYYRPFYARRALRILPLYLLVTAFFLLVVEGPLHDVVTGDLAWSRLGWLTDDPPSQAWYWLLASNLIQGFRGEFLHASLAITWSLAIEEQFYLVWPLVVRRLRGLMLPWACVALMLVAPACRGVVLTTELPDLWAYVFPLCRADALAVGALVAWVRFDDPIRSGRVERLRRFTPLGIVVALVAIPLLARAVISDLDPAARTPAAPLSHPWMLGAGPLAMALLYGGALAVVVTTRVSGRATAWLALGPLRQLGAHSYAIYLVHAPVMALVAAWALHPLDLPDWPVLLVYGAYVVFALGGSLLLAWLLAWTVERPMLRLKARFPYSVSDARNDRTAATASSAS